MWSIKSYFKEEIDTVKKARRIGRVLLISALILLLSSCSSGAAVNKTIAEPSKESIDIFNEFAAFAASLKYEEARKLLEDKYDLVKDNEIVLNNYGFLELHIYRDYEKAEELFKRAIELNPKNPEHYRGMGCVYEAKGRYNKAVEYYETAVRNTTGYENVPINPKLSDLYMDIGDCYLKLNDKKKALEVLKCAAEKNPFSIEANAVLHKLFVEAEEYDKAYEVWKNDNLIDERVDHVYRGVLEWNRLYKDAVEDKKDMTHSKMAGLYTTLLLYDEAATEYKKALTQDRTNDDIKNRLNEVEIYLSFRDELRALLDDYYRERCINGAKEELNFNKRIKPAYEKIAVMFPQIQYNLGSTHGIDMINNEIEKKFQVRIVNIKANGSMLGTHFGRIIDNSLIHYSLWGEEIDLKVITLKNMTSNGLDHWRSMGSGGVGGWSISPREIVKVIQDNGYDGELRLAAFYNKDARDATIKEYGGFQEDKEDREPLEIYFSPSISFKFIDTQIAIEAEKAKAKGISGSELQSYLFGKLEKDFTVRTNIIHESQHSIDNKAGSNFKWSGEAEYKAKLSQLAYGNMQFMCLNQFYPSDIGMEVNNTHTRANTQLFKDIVQYINDNSDKFPQIDVDRNILVQLDKLSEDDIKGIAIEIFLKTYPDMKYQ